MVDVLVGHPEGALQYQRLEHRGVEPPVGARAWSASAASAIAWSFSVSMTRLAEVGVDVAESAARPVAAAELVGAVEPLDLEVRVSAFASVSCWSRRRPRSRRWVGRRSGPDPRARPGTSARSGAGPRRRSPRRTRARSRSGGGRRRSAARRRRARRWTASIARRVLDTPEPVDGAVVIGGLAPGRRRRCAARARSRRAAGSENSEKIGDRLACVARVRRRRSSFGPGWVRSWGRIRPGPYSSTRTRAKNPARAPAPSGPV